MSLGRAEIVRADYAKAYQQKLTRIKAAYEAARNTADQSMQSNVPRLTGALASSSKAELLPNGLGFVMRSYGNEGTRQAYARPVNNGHHIRLKGGGTRFVPPNPFFSQAVADARAKLSQMLRSR